MRRTCPWPSWCVFEGIFVAKRTHTEEDEENDTGVFYMLQPVVFLVFLCVRPPTLTVVEPRLRLTLGSSTSLPPSFLYFVCLYTGTNRHAPCLDPTGTAIPSPIRVMGYLIFLSASLVVHCKVVIKARPPPATAPLAVLLVEDRARAKSPTACSDQGNAAKAAAGKVVFEADWSRRTGRPRPTERTIRL